MKKLISIVLLTFILMDIGYSQNNPNLIEFNKSRNHRTRAGVKTLGVWALGNVAASGYYYYNSKGSDVYFHQMNVMWNSVNVLIVAASLLPKDKNDLNLTQSLKYQSNVEAIYAANIGLDLVYSSVGLYLTEKAKSDLDHSDKWNGWGNALIMQGGFLFLLDTTMFIVHKKNGNKLYKMLDKVNLSTSGLGMKIGIHI